MTSQDIRITPVNGSSLVRGIEQPALLEETIHARLDATADRVPDAEALVVRHQDIRWTYRELQARVDIVAANLLALGLQPGDRVGIWSPNNAEWVLTQFATAKAGLILVNINPAYRSHELAHALKKVGCRALVLAPSFKSSDYLAILASLAPELAHCQPGELVARALPDLRLVIRLGEDATPGMFNFKVLEDTPDPAQQQRLARIAATTKNTDAVNIQFTSGTTGAPKGATLSHRNILNNGYFVGAAIGMGDGDRLCIPVPLYHCFGMVMGNLACIAHGACMVYASEGFEAGAVLETVQTERCTALYGVPTMFIAELDHAEFDRFDLSSLRTGIMAGSPCPIEVMRKVISRMHMDEVTIAYGMTETSPVSFQSSTQDPIERRVSTIGRIQPHLAVKIIDGDGNTTAVGEPGEILTQGYSVMLGYWGDDTATANAVDAEGWMHTGDLGVIDAEGYCNIIGRAKDVVIRGGENIYPREVEEFLYQHPAVQDVQCVGVPDSKYGEELCACVIVKSGADVEADAIRAFCRERIAHYKVPRYVQFVSEFPITVTGKIQKFVLRKQMVAALALEEIRTA